MFRDVSSYMFLDLKQMILPLISLTQLLDILNILVLMGKNAVDLHSFMIALHIQSILR